jgi:tetratricopeptide (TPR) repeat protein
MSNAEKLKRRAAEYEAKRQHDRAIATYQELFALWEGEDPGVVEVSLYNRAGDLMLREGDVPGAVEVWERAVDLYEQGGFPNNAIALCNKILRSAPGRSSVYHKLGRISAKKGFRGDAKRNFLEYADRMQKAGHVEEAFGALREFADLCPDEYEIRQMLADQLTRLGRGHEALEQLQHLFAHHDAEGDEAAAATILARMRTIDPAVEPVRRHRAETAATAPELVYLDLEDAQAPTAARPSAPVAPPAAPAAPTTPVPPVDLDALALEPLEVDLTAPASTPAPAQAADPDALEEFSLDGFEPTSVETTTLDESIPLIIDGGPEADAAAALETSALAGLETTALDGLQYIDETTPLGDAPAAAAGDDLDGLGVLPTAADGASEAGAGEAGHGDLLDLDGLAWEAPPTVEVEASPVSDLTFLNLDEVDAPATTAEDLLTVLRARAAAEPADWALRQSLGEALLEAGDRAGGLAALEEACAGHEAAGDLAAAAAVLDELLRVAPEDTRWHQRRVALATASGDPLRRIEALRALADALFRRGDSTQAAEAYRRVLALDANDASARSALETLGLADVQQSPAPAPAAAPEPDGGYISLGDWLREDEGPKSTRMVVDAEEPSGTRTPTSRTCCASSSRAWPRTSTRRTTRATTISEWRSRRWGWSTRRSRSSRRPCGATRNACGPWRPWGTASWRNSSGRWRPPSFSAPCRSLGSVMTNSWACSTCSASRPRGWAVPPMHWVTFNACSLSTSPSVTWGPV